MTWYREHRQQWILEMLAVYGFINREHLVRKFGISVPQASKDLSSVAAQNALVVYDKRAKRYVFLSGRRG